MLVWEVIRGHMQKRQTLDLFGFACPSKSWPANLVGHWRCSRWDLLSALLCRQIHRSRGQVSPGHRQPEIGRLDQIGSDWIRLDQIGSDWIRLDQIGSDWIGFYDFLLILGPQALAFCHSNLCTWILLPYAQISNMVCMGEVVLTGKEGACMHTLMPP